MARRFVTLLIFVLLASLPGFVQIVFPGGRYPGGRGGGVYPGGRTQGPATSNQNNSSTLTGVLRKIEEKDVIVEADDKTITTVSIAGSTKYVGTSGGNAKIGDFQPGDHVKINANQDSKNAYKAVRMTMVAEGTAEEHSAASVAADDPTRPLPDKPSDGSSKSASDSSNRSTGKSPVACSGNSGNKPTLRRAANSSDDSTASSSSGSSSNSPRSSSSNDDDPDRPRLRPGPSSSDDTLSNNTSGTSSSRSASSGASTDYPAATSSETVRRRRAVSGSDDGSPKAEIGPGDSATTAAPAPRDPQSDSDRPQLRRSPPPADANPVVADARPSLHASDNNGVTRLPSAPPTGPESGGRISSSADDFMDQVREAAFSFSETLPNYVVKQFTTRYGTVGVRGGKSSWKTLDTVTADVIEENGTEKYRNILVNGRTPLRDPEKTGSWSRGEFSSLQLDVLSPVTNADFHGKRSTTIVNRAAFRYEFSVEQRNSHWHMEAEGQSYDPGYTGSIWIDKETFRVLRIELSAQSLPRSFPLDQVESAVDYDYVLIGDGKYLLPTHSEALSCAHAANNCTRNVIEFRDYRKFTADTSITFEADK